MLSSDAGRLPPPVTSWIGTASRWHHVFPHHRALSPSVWHSPLPAQSLSAGLVSWAVHSTQVRRFSHSPSHVPAVSVARVACLSLPRAAITALRVTSQVLTLPCKAHSQSSGARSLRSSCMPCLFVSAHAPPSAQNVLTSTLPPLNSFSSLETLLKCHFGTATYLPSQALLKSLVIPSPRRPPLATMLLFLEHCHMDRHV